MHEVVEYKLWSRIGMQSLDEWCHAVGKDEEWLLRVMAVADDEIVSIPINDPETAAEILSSRLNLESLAQLKKCIAETENDKGA